MKNLIQDIGKKKLIIIGVIFVGIIILIIVALLVYNAFFKTNSYASVEQIVLEAAKEYYADNPSSLPKDLNSQITIDSTTLIAADYLKDLSDLVPDKDASCSAVVTVTYLGISENPYRYVSKLNCGDYYTTKIFTDYIRENESVVLSGQGLYELNGNLVYRGEDPNNNVSLGGKKWKIIKIEDGHVVLILAEKFTKVVWDDRFNVDRNQSYGINDYSVSRVYEYLTDLYDEETLLNDSSKQVVVPHDLYVGKRSVDINYNDGSIEKSGIVSNSYIGLLPLFDYINASVDVNCASADTDSCSNYNYLVTYDYSWWTLTGDSDYSYKVYKIDNYGSIQSSRAATSGYARPVIYLAKDAIYVSGDGTLDNPYTVK
ncbi:MAG: hypothetical protein PUB18_03120 [bacterium]|nr:hypothetical protein [bacterium]